MDWHRPQVAALVEAGVDMLAVETIPSLKEAEAILRLLKEFPAAKAYVTFSCKVCSSKGLRLILLEGLYYLRKPRVCNALWLGEAEWTEKPWFAKTS